MFYLHFSASLWKGFVPGSFWRVLHGAQGVQGQHRLSQDLIIARCSYLIARMASLHQALLKFCKSRHSKPNKQDQREGQKQRHKQALNLSGSGPLLQALPAELCDSAQGGDSRGHSPAEMCAAHPQLYP